MSAGFTPGPWVVHPIMAWVCLANGMDENPVCEMCRTAEDIGEDATFANARLIAAAPRMFDALAVIIANAGLIPDPATGESTDCYAVPIDDIDAAIAAFNEARGEQ